ncbi:MAG: serine/threonine protein kinase, partial [Polyangiaceae bacterium]|nr:serine/threonine protein kinase [Polyangiaceae bacterium]
MSEEASSTPPAKGSGDDGGASARADRQTKPTTSGVRPAEADGGPRLGELKSGELLAEKYRLIRPLGEGGMGSVWVAHSEALDIRVAVKVIKADLGAGEGRVADRLLQEARAAARLGHPAIVRISDFGKTKLGNPFIVMEFLEGEDLGAAMQRRGRMATEIAARTLLPIAHALATAHDKGIIHRDLKPENILLALQEDGSIQPKLIDFGIAKLDNQANERITAAGAVMGSPGYLSPEQARGDDVDARSDIWSFCVVLYEMITGELPFTGKNNYALLRAIIEQEIKPITERGVPDEALWAVLSRGLTKDPTKRWPSMRSLGVALASWLLDQGITEDICGASLESAWIRKRDRNSMPDSGSNPRFSMSGRTPLPGHVTPVNNREAPTLESGSQLVARPSEVPPVAPRESTSPKASKPTWPIFAIGGAAVLAIGVWWMSSRGSDATKVDGAAAGAATTSPASAPTAAQTTTAATPAATAPATAEAELEPTASASTSAAASSHAKAGGPARPGGNKPLPKQPTAEKP